MYVHCFRNRYRATKRLLATNPEAQLLCTGIMIISDKLENGDYDMRTSMFGSSCISFAAKRKISPMIRMIGGRIKISYLLPYRYLKIFFNRFSSHFFIAFSPSSRYNIFKENLP